MYKKSKCCLKFAALLVLSSFVFIGCDDTSAAGEKVYNKRYYQYGYAVKEAPSGGFIIAADSVEGNGSYSDMYVLKVDSKGDIEWSRTIGYISEDIAYDVCVTRDGGYVIGGVSETKGVDEIDTSTWDTGDARIVKFDGKGNLLWDYWNGNAAGRDTVKSIVETSDGGLIATGYTSNGTDTKNEILIIKLDKEGNEVLRTKISDPLGKKGYLAESIKIAADGFVIAGYVSAPELLAGVMTTLSQGFIMKFSIDTVHQSANVVWEKNFGVKELDEAFNDCALAPDGSIIAVGYQTDTLFNGYERKGYVVKTDAMGNMLWEQSFTGDGSSKSSWDDFSSVEVKRDGTIVAAGGTKSYGVKNEYRRDVLLVQFTAQGMISWIKAYDDNGKDRDNYAQDIALLSKGGYAVLGSTYSGIQNGMDIYCLKLDSNGDLN